MTKISLHKGAELLSTIRSYKALYDPSHKEYSVSEKKRRLWCKVATKCNLNTGREARSMFRNLRDCYYACRNSDNPRAKMWKFYTLMDFLDPYIKERRLRRNWTAIAGPPGNEHVYSLVPVGIAVPETTGPINFWNNPENNSMGLCGIINPPNDQILNAATNNELKLRPPIESEDESEGDGLAQVLTRTSTNESLRKFFDAMYTTTSTLPVAEQNNIKKTIFNIVSKEEAEMEGLNNVRIKVEPAV